MNEDEGASLNDDRVKLSVIVVLGALSGMGPLSLDMYLPGLPALQHHFGSSASQVQLTLTACLLGIAIAQIVIGPVSDRVGRRAPLLIALAVFVATSFACAVAPALWVLILLRLVQGVAGGAGIVISRAVVRDLRSGARAVRLFAMLMMVNGLFPALAPVIGAQLLRVGSWRFLFVVLGLLGSAILLASARFLLETNAPDPAGVSVDRSTRRAFHLLVHDDVFVAYALACGLIYGTLFAYIAGSPFVLEDIFRLSPQLFSAVFAMNAAGIVLAGQTSARVVGRIGAHRLLWVGMGCSLTGAVGLFVSSLGHFGLPGVLPSLFLLISAIGIVMPSSTALAMADYPDIAGSASGIIGVVQFLLGAACAPLVGAFGTKSVFPMAVIILALSLGAFIARGFAAHARSARETRSAGPGGSGRPAGLVAGA